MNERLYFSRKTNIFFNAYFYRQEQKSIKDTPNFVETDLE